MTELIIAAGKSDMIGKVWISDWLVNNAVRFLTQFEDKSKFGISKKVTLEITMNFIRYGHYNENKMENYPR